MARCATPKQLPSGAWRYRWRDEQGRQKSATTPSCNDAKHQQALRRTDVAAIKSGERPKPVEPKTFSDLTALWLGTTGAGKRCKKDDPSILRAHLTPAFAHLALTEITYARIEAFKATRGHLSANTVRNILNLLGAMLKCAKLNGWLRLDQMPTIDRPTTPRHKRNFSYLRTGVEIQRFMRAAKDEGQDAHTLFAIAIMTGMRQGELAALTWDRVNFERNFITVANSFESSTKTGDDRIVPIPDPLRPILLAWRAVNPGPLLFSTRTGTMRKQGDRLFTHQFHKTLDTAGFARPGRKGRVHYIRFHDLHHTFASHYMMSEGAKLFELQALLGHKDPELTMIYAHFATDRFEKDFGRFNSIAFE